AVSRSSLTGPFLPSTPATLDNNANGAPSVAIDNAGDVIAVWPYALTGGLAYKRATAGGTWPVSVQTVPNGTHVFSAQSLASNPVGQLVMAFQDTTVGTVISEVNGTVSGGFSTTINPLSNDVASNLHGP